MAGVIDAHLDEQVTVPADQLAKSAKRLATLAGRLSKAIQTGDVRTAEASLRDLEALRVREPLDEAAKALRAFEPKAYLENDFPKEFDQACRDRGISLEGYFPTYSVFPFSVRVDADTSTVLINKKRVGTLRPAVLAAQILAERELLERSPFNAGDFLGALYRMWDRLNLQSTARVVDIKQPVALKKVYQELVPLRRFRQDYPESFFAFDVQRLLTSGQMEHDGRRCQLERGRTAAGAIRLIDRQGQERLISTVDFIEV